MKISNIKKDNNDWYIVEWSPNFIGRLFGRKPKKETYKLVDYYYTLSGMKVFIREDGYRPHAYTQVIDRLNNFVMMNEY